MIDQEKAINGLECCVDDNLFYHAHCDECPYNGCRPDNMGGCTQLYRDALELLKAQEPIEPYKETIMDDFSCFAEVYYCGRCGEDVTECNYCPNCGKKVKWDDGCREKVSGSKETNCIEQYKPDEKGWRYGARKR